MAKDNLYQKSVTAVFFLITLGVAIFFYGNNLEKERSKEFSRQKENNNLADLISQKEAMPLEGFNNLLEESKQAGKGSENPEAGSLEELEKLLSSY